MKKNNMAKFLFFLFFAFLDFALCQSIFIIKSDSYSQYNEAIEGFWNIMESSGYYKKQSVEYELTKENKDKLVQLILNKSPKLIFALGNTAAEAFSKYNISVVFAMVMDPVKYGIIDDLENPAKKMLQELLLKYQYWTSLMQ
ncbi:MAG: hypothetical protein N2Z73_03255 [Endomicrobia bacterium]|nr:hypothetical protein [Endomicrobiia bacterium]